MGVAAALKFVDPRDDRVASQLTTLSRIIAASPALLARERQAFARFAESLAAVITAESNATGDDITPMVAATALVGTHRALVELVRRRLVDGTTDPRHLRAEVQAQGSRAFAALAAGLGELGRAGTSNANGVPEQSRPAGRTHHRTGAG